MRLNLDEKIYTFLSLSPHGVLPPFHFLAATKQDAELTTSKPLHRIPFFRLHQAKVVIPCVIVVLLLAAAARYHYHHQQ